MIGFVKIVFFKINIKNLVIARRYFSNIGQVPESNFRFIGFLPNSFSCHDNFHQTPLIRFWV